MTFAKLLIGLILIIAAPRFPRPLIADAVDVVAFIAGLGFSPRVETIACVAGLDAQGSNRLTDISRAEEPQGD